MSGTSFGQTPTEPLGGNDEETGDAAAVRQKKAEGWEEKLKKWAGVQTKAELGAEE